MEDRSAEDFKVFGTQPPPGWADDAPEEGEGPDGQFEVIPENWPAVRVFLACSTQWDRGASGQLVGLKWASVEIAMRRKGISEDEQDDCWERVTWMERIAVDEFMKRAKA